MILTQKSLAAKAARGFLIGKFRSQKSDDAK